MLLKKHNERQQPLLLKGSDLSKNELKERVNLMGGHIDPLDDHKTTLMHLYDSLIKDPTKHKKILKELLHDEKNFNNILMKKKRNRSKNKSKSSNRNKSANKRTSKKAINSFISTKNQPKKENK